MSDNQTEGNRLNYGFYLRTWFVLLVLTAVEVAVVEIDLGLSAGAVLGALIVTTALKILFIAFNFMHLRFERLGLILIFLFPFFGGFLVYFGIAPDFGLFFGTP